MDGRPCQIAEVRDVRVVADTTEMRFDLALEAGLTYALIGNVWAGSLLIHLLMGRLRPREGTVRVFGRELPRNEKSGIEQLWSYYNSPDQLTRVLARVNVAGRRSKTLDVPYAVELLQAFLLGVPDYVETGTDDEAALKFAAMMLALHPRLMYLDLASLGISTQQRGALLDALDHAKLAERTTVVFTTHDVDEARRMADQVILLDQWGVAHCAPPDGGWLAFLDRLSTGGKWLWAVPGGLRARFSGSGVQAVR